MPLLANDTAGALTRKRIEAFAASRERTTVVAAADAAYVQLSADIAGAGRVVYTMTPTAGRTFTTPTAALLAAGFTDEAVGTSYEFTIVNASAATAITLTAGVGVTLLGVAGMATVAGATSATFVGVFTSASAVSVYRK